MLELLARTLVAYLLGAWVGALLCYWQVKDEPTEFQTKIGYCVAAGLFWPLSIATFAVAWLQDRFDGER